MFYMCFFQFSSKGERREIGYSMQLHQTDDHLSIYHLWGSEAPGFGNLRQSWNIHYGIHYSYHFSHTVKLIIWWQRRLFFFGGGELVGKASLAHNYSKEGELFHSCCTWWFVKAS